MSKKSKTKNTFHVRVIDEWNNEETATIYSIRFVQKGAANLIRVQNLIQKGNFESLLLGLSLHGLHEWQNQTYIDTHPHTYHEIFDETEKEWKCKMSMNELMDMKLFG